MSIEVKVSDAPSAESEDRAQSTVIGIYSGGLPATASAPSLDEARAKRRNFEGKTNQSLVDDSSGSMVIYGGLGDKAELTLDDLRRFGALAVRSSSRQASVDVLLPDELPAGVSVADATRAITEGALLGCYKFTEYKSKKDPSKIETVVVVGGDAEAARIGTRVAKAICLARDLVNHPASALTPIRMAEIATEVASENGLDIKIWDENEIADEGFGGLQGVSLGSDQPPRMIKLTYNPEGATKSLAFVGKGITFDSGGLSLKPADGMVTMKTDMSGAAAVLAAMSVVKEVVTDIKVVGFMAVTENLPGPRATKPGDVLTARNGKTMEVLNTDAEGRLVLSDALSLAVEEDVDAIVDIATLTGACLVALGAEIAGLMTNNDQFGDEVAAAADRAGEPVWKLPLPKRYRKHIDSEIADMKNIGAPRGLAGALSAGLFLQEFVGDKPWVHLDIAGPARAEGDDGYIVKGGTGFSVRTLLETAVGRSQQ